MARIVIVGSGMAAHSAALRLRKALDAEQHAVIVISPQDTWEFTPAGTLVATGRLHKKELTVPLGALYRRQGIIFHQAQAQVLYPQGTNDDPRPQVEAEFVDENRLGQVGRVPYDYLVLATGLRPNWQATQGLADENPHVHNLKSLESCEEAGTQLRELISQVKNGASKRIVVGAGNRLAIATSALLEHCLELDRALSEEGVRDQVDLVYLTGEQILGELESHEMLADQDGVTTSIGQLFRQRGIRVLKRVALQSVEDQSLSFVYADGKNQSIEFDQAMLSAPLLPCPLKVQGSDAQDLSELIYDQAGYALTGRQLELLGENLEEQTDSTHTPQGVVAAEESPAAAEETFFQQFQNPNFDNIYVIGALQTLPAQPLPVWNTESTATTSALPILGSYPAENTNVEISEQHENVDIKPPMPWYVAQLSGKAVASRLVQLLTKEEKPAFVFDPATVSCPYNPFATGRRAWLKRALVRRLALYRARALPLWWLLR